MWCNLLDEGLLQDCHDGMYNKSTEASINGNKQLRKQAFTNDCVLRQDVAGQTETSQQEQVGLLRI